MVKVVSRPQHEHSLNDALLQRKEQHVARGVHATHPIFALEAQNSFIKDVKIRGKAANSDHYFFSEKGVKAFFIYTMGGINAYHDIYDRSETLPLNEFEDLFKLIMSFSTYFQN
ncbi:MAG: hypothetical protein Q8L90_06715 [Bacteroidota bacterium]|nr:hypothetical protein [Bacteroidota bacterium]